MDAVPYLIMMLIGIFIGYKLKNQAAAKHTEPAGHKYTGEESGTGILYEIADQVEEYFSKTAHPKDLLNAPDLKRGIEIINDSDISDDELIKYCSGENILIACIASEALRNRKPDERTIKQIINSLPNTYMWPLYFALQIIAKSKEPVIAASLVHAQPWWQENKLVIQIFNDFISERIKGGENPSFGSLINGLNDARANSIFHFLSLLDGETIEDLLEEFEYRESVQLDLDYLNTVGRIWKGLGQDEILVQNKYCRQIEAKLAESFFKPPKRSILLTGEPGTGKSAVLKMFFKKLQQKGWHVFEASAADILAGQIYIGELEERIQTLLKKLDAGKSVVWYIPNLYELHYAGKHRYSPTGVLDMLLPFIESGNLKIIAEISHAANEKLGRENKQLHRMLEIVSLKPQDDSDTLSLVKEWIGRKQKKGGAGLQISGPVLNEALFLAKQFLNDLETPGNLFQFIKIAERQLLIEGRTDEEITPDDLYAALSQLTGLPRSILDDKEGLDLEELRNVFSRSVLGQPEAVECLVERTAMIKAGLTDSSRPFGVFLFAGPTGTGKTEIVKTLTQFLFGSADRMIRLDMSEFMEPDSIDRILGGLGKHSDTEALVNLIRRQPFSIVLLDEFEKAHRNVWDLFLQVFDDGRLTDRKGNAADFRHTIIIMTSNLGAVINAGPGIGFDNAADGFSLSLVEKNIANTFRPEFLNRIDRVVIFRPLDRAVMRNILFKELNSTLLRRGLRTKEWAVEWEDSAVNFLLEKGFTKDLGARPLKRAIERYLLSPLALTIVDHKFPEGDQFLFVKSSGREIQVEFIDPDASDDLTAAPAGDNLETEAAPLSLKTILLDPKNSRQQLDYIKKFHKELEEKIESSSWEDLKSHLISHISSKDFWDSADRYEILSNAEYMDRIEAGLQTAKSLMNRISNTSQSAGVFARLVQQLYLLNEAYECFNSQCPKDVFLKIETNPNTEAVSDALTFYAKQLREMYLAWAKKRGMKYKILQENINSGLHNYTFILAVSGFGAYSILSDENGIHVFEKPKKERTFEKFNVKVTALPQQETVDTVYEDLLVQAQNIFHSAGQSSSKVVRRYRREPSPLVKDNSKNWRTGRIDRVLAGDFDLFE